MPLTPKQRERLSDHAAMRASVSDRLSTGNLAPFKTLARAETEAYAREILGHLELTGT